MLRPYKSAVCRGSWQLGTACGHCERCEETRPYVQPIQTPDEYYAKRFSQSDIDRAVAAERERIGEQLKDIASRANAFVANL